MEETFGPVIGIMKVESDDEALSLMNDSPYGLVSCSHLRPNIQRATHSISLRWQRTGHEYFRWNNARRRAEKHETTGTSIPSRNIHVDQQTASVWTDPSSSASLRVFNHFFDDLECGTVYLNRADALEPSLPWA